MSERSLASYLWYVAAFIVPRLGTLVALGVLTRHLSPESYGYYALAQAWLSLVVTVAFYWQATALHRMVPEQLDGPGVASVYGVAYVVTVATLAVLGAPIAFLGEAVTPGLGWGMLAALVGQSTFFVAHHGVVAGMERRKLAAYAITEATVRIGLLVYGVRTGHGIAWLVGVPPLFGAVIFLAEAVLLRAAGKLALRVDRTILWSMVRFGLPMMAVWFGALALSSLDRFMIAWLAGPAVVGLYSAAYPLGEAMVQVFGTPMTAAFAPRLFALHAKEGEAAAHVYLNRLMEFCLLGLAVITSISVSAGRSVAEAFLGGGFRAGARSLFPLVAAGLAFWVLGSMAAKRFEIQKRPGAIFPAILAAVVVNALANLVLIPRQGALGAAIATLLAYGLYYFAVARSAGMKPLGLLLGRWRLAIAGGGAVWIGLSVEGALRLPAIVTGGLAATVTALSFVCGLWALRDPQTLRLIRARGL